jgi:hypothetical protein
LTPSIATPPVVIVETVAVIEAPAAPFAARFELHVTVTATPAVTGAFMTIVRTPLDTADDVVGIHTSL